MVVVAAPFGRCVALCMYVCVFVGAGVQASRQRKKECDSTAGQGNGFSSSRLKVLCLYICVYVCVCVSGHLSIMLLPHQFDGSEGYSLILRKPLGGRGNQTLVQRMGACGVVCLMCMNM